MFVGGKWAVGVKRDVILHRSSYRYSMRNETPLTTMLELVAESMRLET
jgi:hypothetical protein